MGSHWSVAHNGRSSERKMASSTYVIACAALKLCSTHIARLADEREDAGLYPFGYSFDLTVARLASDAGEGFFGGAASLLSQQQQGQMPATRDGEVALVLMDAISDALKKFRPYQPRNWITLSPCVLKNSTSKGRTPQPRLDRTMCMRAEPFNSKRHRSRFLMSHLNSLMEMHVSMGEWGGPLDPKKTLPDQREDMLKERSNLQAKIHRILYHVREFDRSRAPRSALPRDQYSRLRKLARRWIELDVSLQEGERPFSAIPTPSITRFFCKIIGQTRVLIPAGFFQKKKAVRTEAFKIKNTVIVPYKIPRGKMISPLLTAAIEEHSRPEPEPGLEIMPDFCLDDEFSQTGDNAADDPGGARELSSASLDSALEKMFGGAPSETNDPPAGGASDGKSPVFRDEFLHESPNWVNPMCLESRGPCSPQLLYNNGNSAFQTLGVPPLLPNIHNISEHKADEGQEGLRSNHRPSVNSKGSQKNHNGSKYTNQRKRRRKKALLPIDAEKHPIPTSKNKNMPLWRTNPITKEISSTHFYCHVPSCYLSKTSQSERSKSNGKKKKKNGGVPARYQTYPILMQHYKYHLTPPQFCPICNESFASTGSCNTHIKKQHSGQIQPGLAPPRAKRRTLADTWF